LVALGGARLARLPERFFIWGAFQSFGEIEASTQSISTTQT
jgi:hypothetical protein